MLRSPEIDRRHGAPMGDYQSLKAMFTMFPRKLPVINLYGEEYFLDLRLSQLRKVGDPHEFRDLSPGERKDLLGSALLS